MRPKTTVETAIICVTGLIAIGILAGDDDHNFQSPYFIWTVISVMAALGVIAWFRYLTSRSQSRVELSGTEEYRRLADEYRRLSDLAITAQEHTDLKLGDVSVQLDYLRSQVDSLQKILKEVE
jgi:hypothetical protein